jgi:primosomal protein N' (replication factor Y) (superfamily II helicase)
MSQAPLCVLKVALALPLPRCFDYLVSNELIGENMPGRRVRVPFGKDEKIGVIDSVEMLDASQYALKTTELKNIIEILDAEPIFSRELFSSLHWLGRYTQAPMGEVFATALPVLLRQGQALPDNKVMAWELTSLGRHQYSFLRANTQVRKFAERLLKQPVSEDQLDIEKENWRNSANTLKRRAYVERIALPPSKIAVKKTSGPIHNAEQKQVLHAIEKHHAAQHVPGFHCHLLEGVTGSGKTEIYLQAIEHCLQRGQQALILVPEIGLTPQTLKRFRERLGVPVHAMHSGLNDGERARAWAAMARGDAQVLVGTRSAVFVPMPNAGLIIIDEEHDASYKQQDGIRYHARDFAIVRAKALNVPIILGSATPSLESLHNALAGRYQHLHLKHRAGNAKPPKVRVLDIRKRPLNHGLSSEVLEAIKLCVQRGEQVLVFKNRRGYAPVLLCHDCGWTAQCPRCDSPMSVHGVARNLQCHHCGHRKNKPASCPDCSSLALQPQGVGTERLEEALAAAFPEAPLLRIDSQTTRNKDGLQKKLAELGDKAGILVGTQILAKGHDLPKLTLVCVIGIDEGLFSADFRASEKLSQLLIQVTGRAGRAEWPGEVLLQTHHPEHPMLNTLLAGGYPAVAALELAQREAANFPPFAHIALLRAEALKEEDVTAFLREAHALCEKQKNIELSAPMPAPMPRRAGKMRGQILISAAQRPVLQAILQHWVQHLYELKSARKVRWSIDVDPVDLY